jgi:prephenate dehydrogenase
MIRRLAVIGVGLIGGSLARALRAAGCVGEVVGCGRSAANLERALELGVIDRWSHDPAQAVAGADLVFVAVPLGTMGQVFGAIRDGTPLSCPGEQAFASAVTVLRVNEAVAARTVLNFQPSDFVA